MSRVVQQRNASSNTASIASPAPSSTTTATRAVSPLTTVHYDKENENKINKLAKDTPENTRVSMSQTTDPAEDKSSSVAASEKDKSTTTKTSEDEAESKPEDDSKEENSGAANDSSSSEEKKVDPPKKKKRTDWPLKNISDPHENDVLYGRGGGTNHHPGNKRYRKMVEGRKLDYVNSKRLDKPLVALEIIKAWREQDPPGRFLKIDEKTGLWHDVGDKKAREKTSQALREKAPQIRKQQEEEKLGTDHPEQAENKVSFAEGTNTDDGKGVSKPKMARVHSLGREIIDPNDGVTLEGFSWQEGIGSSTPAAAPISVTGPTMSQGSVSTTAAVAPPRPSYLSAAPAPLAHVQPAHAPMPPTTVHATTVHAAPVHAPAAAIPGPSHTYVVPQRPVHYRYGSQGSVNSMGPPAMAPPGPYSPTVSETLQFTTSGRFESWGSLVPPSLTGPPQYIQSQGSWAGPPEHGMLSRENSLTRGVMSRESSLTHGVIPREAGLAHGMMSRETSLGRGIMTRENSLGRGIMTRENSLTHGMMSRETSLTHGMMSRENSLGQYPLAHATVGHPAAYSTFDRSQSGASVASGVYGPPYPGPPPAYGGPAAYHYSGGSQASHSLYPAAAPAGMPTTVYTAPNGMTVVTTGVPVQQPMQHVGSRTSGSGPALGVDPAVASAWAGQSQADIVKTLSGEEFDPVKAANPLSARTPSMMRGPVKPDIVKRATSNQNETPETKPDRTGPSVKRAALNRDSSNAANRLKEICFPGQFTNGRFDATKEVHELSEDMGRSTLREYPASSGGVREYGPPPSASAIPEEARISALNMLDDIANEGPPKAPRPTNLSDTNRTTTLDRVAMSIATKPHGMGSRTNTYEGIALDLADDPILRKPSGVERKSTIDLVMDDLKTTLPRPGALASGDRLTTSDFLQIVNEPIADDDPAVFAAQQQAV